MTWGLSEQIKKQIIELRKDGLSYNKTARALKLTKGQVAGVVFRAGLTQPRMCESCGIYPADWPSRLCPGCQAYQEHQHG